MARRLIFSFFATFLASSLLRAVEYEGQFTGKEDGIISSGTKGMLSLSFKFKARFWLSHMGKSPLQNLQFFWNFTDADGIQGSYLGPSIPTADKVSMPLRDVDPDIRKKIQLYDVLVRIEGKAVDSGKRLYIDFDAGIPGDEGEENFNVSGSPKWSELFYEAPKDHLYEGWEFGDGRKRDYISEAAAKHVMKSGFRATDVKVIKARWNLNAFHSWYAQNYGAARREALRRTAQDLIAATESIQDTAVTSASNNKNGEVYTAETRLRGMEIEGMSRGLESRLRNLENDISNRKSPLSELEKFVTKLRGGIPEQFRIPAREEAYQKALKSIGDDLDRELNEIAAHHPVPNPEYAAWLEGQDKKRKALSQVDIVVSHPASDGVEYFGFTRVLGYALDPTLTHVTIKVNGDETEVLLKEGAFTQDVTLRDGENRIEVCGAAASVVRIIKRERFKSSESSIKLDLKPYSR